MLLGDLLANVGRSKRAGDVTALLDDLTLVTRVAAAAGAEGTEPETYVVRAVSRFQQEASPDDWVSRARTRASSTLAKRASSTW